MDAPLIDEIMLRCMFQPRYMTFDMCLRLEPVSKLFMAQADAFYRKIDRLGYVSGDENENWARKIYRRCPNVKTIEDISVSKYSLKRDNIRVLTISKIKGLSSIGVNFFNFSPETLLPFVDMPNLHNMEISTRYIFTEFDPLEMNPIEKLRVTSLKCDRLFLLDFFDLNRLSVLYLENLRSGIDELIVKLRDCCNLTQLTIELQESKEIQQQLIKLIYFVVDQLQVDDFSLKLLDLKNDDDLIQLTRLQDLRKNISGVTLGRLNPENVPRILQMSKLSSLSLTNVSCPLEIFQRSLPNLSYLEDTSWFDFETPKFNVNFYIKTSYTKKLVHY